jgi:hypothetical protein
VSTPINPLLTRLIVLYDPPETHDGPAWMAEVSRLIADYSAAELADAFDLIVRTHRGRGFPTVSEIVTGCADARSKRMPNKPKAYPVDDMWSEQAYALADKMVCGSELGRQAARGNYLQAVHEYVRRHKRLPKGVEVRELRDAADFVDGVVDGSIDAGTLAGPLRKLGRSIQQRRAELGERLFPGSELTPRSRAMAGEGDQ